MFATNTSRHESTGYIPAFLNFGRELKTPAALYRPDDPPVAEEDSQSTIDYHSNRLSRMKKIHEFVKVKLAHAFKRQKHYYIYEGESGGTMSDQTMQHDLKLRSVICPIGCETATTTRQPGKFASDTAEVKPTVTHLPRANLILTPPIFLPVTQLVLCWNCGYPGHNQSKCLRKRRLFCSQCGKIGVMSTKCCRQPKQAHLLQRTRSNSAAAPVSRRRRDIGILCNLIYIVEDGSARFPLEPGTPLINPGA
ncbi:hypothetical protein HHI36_001169 [Cryptolaemus montrouzieri]|uniref:CCHC-type domain-containing protein n=1 Tax=Cryptolaemus montrouzieri TaxID=559131 RepID=A0ABD2P6T4_9CUCU